MGFVAVDTYRIRFFGSRPDLVATNSVVLVLVGATSSNTPEAVV